MLTHHQLKVYEKALALGASRPRGSHPGKRAFEPNHRHVKQILKVQAISRSTKGPTKGPGRVWARHQNVQSPDSAFALSGASLGGGGRKFLSFVVQPDERVGVEQQVHQASLI